MKPHKRILTLLAITTLGATLDQGSAWAQGRAGKSAKPAPASGPTSLTEGERVNVDAIKQKYWARGDQSELGVVQNRLYSKERKFELGVIGGVISSDPFLSIKATGGTFGYHFSEYLSLVGVAWKSFAGGSTALKTFEEQKGALNPNKPTAYYGLEGNASVLYGKLSLVGKKIIYYDMHLSGGAGLTSTGTGSYFTPSLGVGQKVYLTKSTSLRVDYRVMRYNEKIEELIVTKTRGNVLDNRINYSHVITIGINLLIGGGVK